MNKRPSLPAYLGVFTLGLGLYVGLLAYSYVPPTQEQISFLLSPKLTELFTGQSILYNAFILFFSAWVRLLRLAVRPEVPWQTLNSVLGALGLIAQYRLINGITKDRALAIPLVVGFAVSYYYLQLAAGCFPGMISVCCMLASMVLVMRMLKRAKPRHWVYLGLLQAVAMLFQQVNVLFSFVAACAILLIEPGMRSRLRAVFLYGLPLFFLYFWFSVPVSFIQRILHRDFSFVPWAGVAVFPFGSFSWRAGMYDLAHAFMNADRLFASMSVSDPGFNTSFILGLAGVFFCGFVLVLVSALSRWRAVLRGFGKPLVINLAFLGAWFAVFATGGGRPVLFGEVLIPLWLLASIAMKTMAEVSRERAIVLSYLFPFILFTINFFITVFPPR